MVVVFYERLPVFYYKCGLVNHTEDGCLSDPGETASGEASGVSMVMDHM